jgi:hypothetical protein
LPCPISENAGTCHAFAKKAEALSLLHATPLTEPLGDVGPVGDCMRYRLTFTPDGKPLAAHF